ncbi:Chromosome transmission fidelity protein 18-like protein [Thalictrum thalictroides]|uniref:Chromosome transmission fidelity protein 18 homolog n=1 Tax=Thalictrum thalictroides TaxID=46969 RepID=A0A7J6WSN5_THATH|nr:Chromosome transmission fidelity protein 18-like protein [Thalictrum thalictroides]
MNMDMDDIPNPDELEWLESHALPPEEEEDFDFYYPEEEVEQHQPQPPSPPTKLPEPSSTLLSNPLILPENQINRKKRIWSENNTSTTVDSTSVEVPQLIEKSKKSRLPTAETEIEEEEDWLRRSPSTENADTTPPAPIVHEEKFISRYASEIVGNFIAITGPDGNRVYAKMDQVEMNDNSLKTLSRKGYASGLIQEPINVLIDKMEQEAFAKALQASSESPESMIHHEAPVVSEKLWVEKYAPNSFTELLSDEQINREVLLWLKQWDSCVFGSEIRSTNDDVLSALKRHSSVTHHQKVSDTSFTSKNRRSPYTNTNSVNSNNMGQERNNLEGFHGVWDKKARAAGPPDHKVLLLCGPPGLGKTTLAHVAAKHCGYRVVEINASDDRSSSTIEAKILDVVQMNSIMSDGKPKCLVIDEIDGALGEGKGAVEVILKMVAAERKFEAVKGIGGQEGEKGKVSSKKKRKIYKVSLSKPLESFALKVICICNDLYAPALRPLRQVAKIHTFVQPTVNRVVSRLKYICNKEGFRTSSISLTVLAEYTECDIRSCLNTLQFLNKKNEKLNLLEIGSQVVGRKDVSRSAFDIWKEIFQKRKSKRERKSMNGGSSLFGEFDFLHSLISNRGEYELTMDGIHENMLQLHYHDPMMQKTVDCLNILGVSDYLHHYIMRTQQMSLLAYQSSNAIAIRRLISQIEKPNIEWPKSFQRHRMLLAEKKDLLRCWQTKITPFLSRHMSIESFVEDSLSPLLYILSPRTLRPVALHSQSEREKGVLTQLVDKMVSYSITYKSRKSEPLPGTFRHEATSEAPTLAFDPPIDEFINFKEYRSEHIGINLAMKQVLVHEVEKQRFLQQSIVRCTPSDVGVDAGYQALPRQESDKTLSTSAGADAYVENARIANSKFHLGESKLKTSTNLIKPVVNKSVEEDMKLRGHTAAKKPSRGASNFFDRFRKNGGRDSQTHGQSLQKRATLERDSRPLLFKFNEGFTNAVKRPVRVRDLLL